MPMVPPAATAPVASAELYLYLFISGNDTLLNVAAVAKLEPQIAAAEEAGYVSTPLFITEMNQKGMPDPEFITAAYEYFNRHNRHSRQDIVAACWFVYHDETSDWGFMALENSEEAVEALGIVGHYPPGQ